MGGAEGSPYGIHMSQVLPNLGLQELLNLVELRDAFVVAQIRQHKVRGDPGIGAGGTQGDPGVWDGMTCVPAGVPIPPGGTVLAALQGRDPGVWGVP